MNAMVDELGGAEQTARKLMKRGSSPLKVAIAILGGTASAAQKLGVRPGTLYYWLKHDIDEWPFGYLRRLSELTGIPIDLLKEPGELLAEPTDRSGSDTPRRPRR